MIYCVMSGCGNAFIIVWLCDAIDCSVEFVA